MNQPIKHRNDTFRESHWNMTNELNTVILYSHNVIPWIKNSRNLTSSEPNAPLRNLTSRCNQTSSEPYASLRNLTSRCNLTSSELNAPYIYLYYKYLICGNQIRKSPKRRFTHFLRSTNSKRMSSHSYTLLEGMSILVLATVKKSHIG